MDTFELTKTRMLNDSYLALTKNWKHIEYETLEDAWKMRGVKYVIFRKTLGNHTDSIHGNLYVKYEYANVDKNGNSQNIEIEKIACLKITGSDDTTNNTRDTLECSIIDSNDEINEKHFCDSFPFVKLFEFLNKLSLMGTWKAMETEEKIEAEKNQTIEILNEILQSLQAIEDKISNAN